MRIDDSPRRRQADTFGGQDSSNTETYLHCSIAASHSLMQKCVGWQEKIYGTAAFVIQFLSIHIYTGWQYEIPEDQNDDLALK